MFYALCSIPSDPVGFGLFIHPITTKGIHMIFKLVQATPTHGTLLVCKDEDTAVALYEMLLQFSSALPMICCYGGYCNAVELT